MRLFAAEGSSSRLSPRSTSTRNKCDSSLDTDLSASSLLSSGDQSSAVQPAPSPANTSLGSVPLSGSTTSMSYDLPLRAVLENAIARPELDQIAAQFADFPSVRIFAAASPCLR